MIAKFKTLLLVPLFASCTAINQQNAFLDSLPRPSNVVFSEDFENGLANWSQLAGTWTTGAPGANGVALISPAGTSASESSRSPLACSSERSCRAVAGNVIVFLGGWSSGGLEPQRAAGVGGHILGPQPLAYRAPGDVVLRLIAVVGVEQHAALAQRVDAPGLAGLIGTRELALVQLPITWLASAMGVWLFFVQHQFEATSWERDGEWSLHHGGLSGSSHLDLPPMLRWLTANIGAHHVHHLCASIPSYRLGEVLRDHPELAKRGEEVAIVTDPRGRPLDKEQHLDHEECGDEGDGDDEGCPDSEDSLWVLRRLFGAGASRRGSRVA